MGLEENVSTHAKHGPSQQSPLLIDHKVLYRSQINLQLFETAYKTLKKNKKKNRERKVNRSGTIKTHFIKGKY